ncbi:MAG: glutamine-hydrolyzing GMP synthase, partial [Chthonomonas sp.]|nr:glutamine-hydrolyzing GMP synthase [Chthonomonas sp.]
MSERPQHQLVLVVDFGGQYSQLIVRRVREHGIYSELVAWDKAQAAIADRQPSGIIFSGGPNSVSAPGAPTIDVESLIGTCPILGICYGHQLLAYRLGGRVHAAHAGEYGRRQLVPVDAAGPSLVSGLDQWQVWMSHGDQVDSAPPGSVVTAQTDSCPVAAYEDRDKKIFAVQFHPEVSHTLAGSEILRRFLFDICGLRGDWTSERFIEETVETVRMEVGDQRVLCAVSGGVDSSVVAALMTKALGEQVTCV